MRTAWLTLTALTSLSALGCTNTPAYLYGKPIANMEYTRFKGHDNEGVYPDTSVLLDPNNPFAGNPPTTRRSGSCKARAVPGRSPTIIRGRR
jgi:hypothetical protein